MDMQQFRAVARQTGSYNASRVELSFMTLSQASPAQSLAASLLASPSNGPRHDKATLVICEKAAEQGLLTRKSPWHNSTPLAALDRRTW